MRSGEQTQLVSLQAEIERMTSELSDLKAERDVAVAQRRVFVKVHQSDSVVILESALRAPCSTLQASLHSLRL